jgi:sterol desaturase/sphingolipid hydroxylase (fatty acid hydroxylase superfamily)
MTEGTLRLGLSLALFALFAVLEALAPARRRALARRARWAPNLGLGLINAAAQRLVAPLGAAGAALWAQGADVGLFQHASAPAWLVWLVCLVAFDLALWAQHRATHAFPALWALHRVHHLDVELDVTTAYRFHPLEIAVSLAWKSVVAVLLGAPPEAVLAFEALVNAFALFNHANWRLPARVEAALGALVVTPGLHRVHHSVRPAETDSNFGFCLSIWDRLFGAFRPRLADPQGPLGLAEARANADAASLLAAPFRPRP